MPLVIPEGFAHIALEFRHALDPEPWYVTFGVDSSNYADSPGDLGLLCMAAWQEMYTWQSTEVTQPAVQVTMGVASGEPIRQYVPFSGPTAGSHAVPKLPQNCAMLVRKNTGLGGRRNRGRFFVPGMLTEEGVNNVGVIVAGDRTSYQGGIDAFFAYLAGGGLEPAPMYLLHATSSLSATPPPTLVTSLTVDQTISTQRRRLR